MGWEDEGFVFGSGSGSLRGKRLAFGSGIGIGSLSAKLGAKDLRVGELSGRSTKTEEMRQVGSCLTQK